MKTNRDQHPVSQNATKVIFACFIGYCVLAFVYSAANHFTETPWFRVYLPVLTFVMGCAVVTYFRPRGLPAFVTSTVFVGCVAVLGMFEVSRWLPDGRWGTVLAWIAFIFWLAAGIYLTTKASRDGKAFDEGKRDASE